MRQVKAARSVFNLASLMLFGLHWSSFQLEAEHLPSAVLIGIPCANALLNMPSYIKWGSRTAATLQD